MEKTKNQKVTACRQRLYDQIQFNVPKGYREVINAHAKSMNETTNEFIRRAIAQTMESDSPTK